jgi:hypothetical protein
MINRNTIALPLFVLAFNLWHGGRVRLETRDKIADFAKLPYGWHYGTGTRPSDATIALAIDFHDFFLGLGFIATDAFPGGDGEIVVTAYEGEHCLEVIAEADGSVSIIHEIGEQPGQPRYRLSTLEARHLLMEIASQIWNTSDYSMPSFLTKGGGASQVSHSGIRAATAASLSFRAIVYENEARLYANTYAHSMHRWLETLSYSGNSRMPLYRLAAASNKRIPIPETFATTML